MLFATTLGSDLPPTDSFTLKVIADQENEWGYACRVADLTEYIGGKLWKGKL